MYYVNLSRMKLISWLKLDPFLNCDIQELYSKMRPPKSQGEKKKRGMGEVEKEEEEKR